MKKTEEGGTQGPYPPFATKNASELRKDVAERAMKDLKRSRQPDCELLDRAADMFKSAVSGRAHNRRAVLKAVLHQLENGDASQGDPDDIRWCALQLKDLLSVEL
jgi:hypothetical protein